MKNFFQIMLFLVFVFCIQLLLQNVVLAAHYVITETSTTANQTFENFNETAPSGGVFYIGTGGKMTITSATFKNNQASQYGGAIYNRCILTIEDGVMFSSNTSKDGGAIHNNSNGKITIRGERVIFDNNNSSDKGGAIANNGSMTIEVKNIVFSSNTASYNGGAIHNYGDDMLTVIGKNVEFKNNTAGVNGNGGAIYNGAGTINLVSARDMKFTGNKASGVSNAIYDNCGIINLYAGEGAQIVFNDRITSEDSYSVLNINQSTTTLNAIGKVVLNEDMSGYTGTVYLYDGEIKLEAKTEEGSNINTNKFFSGDIHLSSGTLNVLNNAIDNIVVSSFSSTINTNLKFDVDLSNDTSDNFTVLNTARGALNLTAINILGIYESTGTITLFNGVAPKLNVLTTAYYGGYEYSFSKTAVNGELEYKLTGTEKTFKEVVNDTVPVTRSYSLAGDEVVTEDLGDLGGDKLTIFGNGKNIEGNNVDGISVGSGKTLDIENVNKWSGFSGVNGALKNEGTLIISSVNFSGNSRAISNYGGETSIIGGANFSSNSSAGDGGAIYNYSNSTMTISGDNITFSSNSAAESGGAIYNNAASTMTISGDNIEFSSNTAVYGGAIYNDSNSTMTITGTDVVLNYNIATSSGGAIYNDSNSTMTISGDNVIFSSNSALKEYGGAIYNEYTTMTIEGKNIVFSSNTAKYHGGAIYNDSASTMTISGDNVTFSSNSAADYGGAINNNNNSTMTIEGKNIVFSSNTVTTCGGAIYNSSYSTMTIEGENIVFSSNTAKYRGGAIYNSSYSTMTIEGKNIVFSSNTAKYRGGAIYNDLASTMTISGDNITFDYNTATSSGGAIYNGGGSTLNLVSTENMEFRGNKANGVSNAIHDESGTINLFASENAQIIFNDRITSANSNSILNINESTTTVNAVGKIVLNEDMSGYTGTVNLYGGEIELQAKPNSSNENTNKFFSGDIYLSSGTLNIQNGAIDNITVSSLTTTANANLKFDVDLSNNTSDNFTITNNANAIGELNLTAINILGIYESTGTITLFNDEIAPELNVLTTAYYGGYEYSFSTTAVNGELEYKLTGTTETFKEVVNDTVPVTRSYSLAGDEVVTEDLGDLGGDKLTIFGNGKNIEGEGLDGIYIAEGKTLDIENVNKWSGFSGANGALKNEGTLIISGVNFSGNSRAISNYGGETSIIGGANFNSNSAADYGGAIYNCSSFTMTISGDNVIFSSNSALNDGGGAIYNRLASTMTIIGGDVIFSSNSALNDGGGAIYNRLASTMTISGDNVIFSSNSANSDGGAINNYNKSTMTISGGDVIFSSNSANSDGGAIYNDGSSALTVIGEKVEFKNNTAGVNGGAIYNDGSIINLVSNGDMEFTGNKAKGVSNAIHDESGTINLYAGENAKIIFNDRITSGNSGSVLNINQSTTTLNAIGKVVLNEDMSGYTGTVNLYGGEIELQAKPNSSNENTNKFFSGDIHLSSGTLNIQNRAIDNITVNSLTTTKNVNLKFDADLSNNTSDNFTITNLVTGELNLTAINILGIKGSTGTITLFNDENSPVMNNELGTAYYEGYEYSFSTTAVNGELEYKLTGIARTFKEVVNDTVPVTRSYSLAGDEVVTEDLGDLGGERLTIFGNGKNIEGEGLDGIYIAEGKTLDVENVNSWQGFKGDNGALRNEGTLIISGVNFSGNSRAISNYGGETSIIGGANFSSNSSAGDGGAIYNSSNSTMTIRGGDVIFSSNSANSNGGAIYNRLASTMTIIGENVIFRSNSSNSETNDGGAISNNDSSTMTISGDNVIFSSNSANSDGGAINNCNNSTMTIRGGDVIFSSNSAAGAGGAIYNHDYTTMTISGGDVIFSSNSANSNGGAIYNRLASTMTIIGENVIFRSNSSNSETNDGGAISNNDSSTMTISGDNVIFSSNSANSDGGAINNYNNSTMTIRGGDVIFSSNSAAGSGGAIYNHANYTTMVISGEKVEYSSNSANNNGGAIYNDGSSVLTVIGEKVEFKNNTAGVNGGAIYNDGSIINLVSNGDMEFTGNTENGVSNAIHDSSGTINLYASNNAKIIFNDRITSENSNSVLNINQSTTTVNAVGKIVLNEDMSGYTGTVNLYGGEIELQAKPNSSNENTNKFFSGDINLSSGTLNIQNRAIDNITVNSLITTANADLKFDVDLSNNTSDNFTVLNDANGELNLTAINILGIKEDTGTIKLFNNEVAPELNILTTVYYGGYEYSFSTTAVTGELEYGLTGTVKTFKEVVNDEVPLTRSYSLAGDEEVVEDLEDLGGDKLTIFGNWKNIEGKGVDGICIARGKTLDIEKVNKWSGFSGENGALKNEGTLIISGVNFSDNGDKDITNNGNLILSGLASSFEKGIVGTGTTTVKGVKITLNDARLEQGKIEIKETGSLITSATNVIGNIENDGNLIFNRGEINNNKITGSGLLNITAKDIINNNTIEQGTITISETKFINNSVIKTNKLNLNSVDFKLTEEGNLTVENLSAQNSTIDMANSILNELNIGKLTVNGAFNLSVDADLANKQMDTITANEDSSVQGKINVEAINILSDAAENKTEILFTSSTVLQDKITSVKTASSALYKYDVIYNSNSGKFEFLLTGETNPVLVESQVATAVGGIFTQTAVLKQAFTSIDSAVKDRYLTYYEASNRKNKKKSNLYASTVDLLYSDDTNTIEKGLWIRPYAIQDTININDLSVDNTAIGTLAGLDLSVGENSLLSFYIGYAGSIQKYEDVKINQTGYILGATGMIIKDDCYLGLTANVNFNKAESESNLGVDKFDMNMYSVGAKVGYNMHLGKKWIIEPNLTLMYGNINTQEYKTKQGALIDSQSTNNILIEPQVKAKLNLANGWTPYALVGYVFDSGSKSKLVANNIAFDDMQITGYAEYGLGVNKSFKDSSWSCSLQVTGKGGDRNGVDGNIGVKYSF